MFFPSRSSVARRELQPLTCRYHKNLLESKNPTLYAKSCFQWTWEVGCPCVGSPKLGKRVTLAVHQDRHRSSMRIRVKELTLDQREMTIPVWEPQPRILCPRICFAFVAYRNSCRNTPSPSWGTASAHVCSQQQTWREEPYPPPQKKTSKLNNVCNQSVPINSVAWFNEILMSTYLPVHNASADANCIYSQLIAHCLLVGLFYRKLRIKITLSMRADDPVAE